MNRNTNTVQVNADSSQAKLMLWQRDKQLNRVIQDRLEEQRQTENGKLVKWVAVALIFAWALILGSDLYYYLTHGQVPLWIQFFK